MRFAPYAVGLVTAIAIAGSARVLVLIVGVPWLSETLVAVAGGVVVTGLWPGTVGAMPGLRFATTSVLRTGIVLLGAQLSLVTVVQIGTVTVALVGILMAVAFAVALRAGALLGIPGRLAILIAVGTAICGNTAIVSTAPIIDADDKEVSYAVGTITLFGMVALFAYPLIAYSLDMTQSAFGLWAGTAINDTSQVVAAAGAFGAGALSVATVVKLTRNALMLPVLVAIALLWRRAGRRQNGSLLTSVLRAVPLFVVAFLFVAAARSMGWISDAMQSVSYEIARALILVALAAIGLKTSIRDIAGIGVRPLALGLTVAALVGALSILSMRLMGIDSRTLALL